MLGAQLPKNFHWVRWGIVVALAAGLLAGPVPVARADTSVCGPITVNTTWTLAGNNYIVTCLVQVMQNVTLTIEPGVRVYFNAGMNLRIDGKLIAQGVTFGSANAAPAPGDWGRIFFMATSDDAIFDANGNYLSGSILKDSTVVYGGGGVEGAVMTYGASPYLVGNTVISSASYGIYAQGRSADQPVVLKENFVNDNIGGIHVSLGYVISNTIENNNATDWGGGIYASNSTISGNTIDANHADVGGGIYASSSTLTGNIVSSNTASSAGGGQGGGIYATGGILNGNIISGNHARNTFNGPSHGGGVYITSGTVMSNTISGNLADGGTSEVMGGGVYASLSTITGNKIYDNTAKHDSKSVYGGGLYASGGIVTHNTLTGNAAIALGSDDIGYGGGVYANGGTVSNNSVSSNTASGRLNSKGGGIYGNTNTLTQNTITLNSANQGGAVYSYKGTVTNNTVLTNTTTLSGTVYIDQGTATLNLLKGNSAVAGGAIYCINGTSTGNIVKGNSADYGAGIYTKDCTLLANTLRDNAATTAGGGIYASGGEVTNNNLTGNMVPSWGHGSGAYLSGVTDFSYNDVLTNTASGGTVGGVSISGQPVFQYNNLHGNQPYDAEIVSSQDVTGALNYWGSLACLSIPNRIYDGSDAPGRGKLAYAPSLYSPVPVAQLNAPTGLTLGADNQIVSLSWTPLPALPSVGCRLPGSTAPDLTYRVYYNNDSACGPFDGRGLTQGDSPISVGAGSSLVVSGLTSSPYYFTVTAVDYLGRESAYSNLVVRAATGQRVYLPLISVQE
jgi:hypothetical protein